MNITRSIILIPLAALLLSGCAQRSEYAAFAQAGAKYAHAVDNLLVAAGKAQVDSTSWRLVADKKDIGKITHAKYMEKAKLDEERLAVIKRLRLHSILLGQYFYHLEVLATSDAPNRAEAEIEEVVNGLQNLSSASSVALPALPVLGQVVIDGNIRTALKEELNKRQDIIRKELQLQAVLLDKLEGQISHALSTVKNIKEQEVVIPPLLADSPLANPEEWVAKRHEIVNLPGMVEELNLARNASDKMQETFDALLSGDDVVGRINALIIDIESILNIADAINS